PMREKSRPGRIARATDDCVAAVNQTTLILCPKESHCAVGSQNFESHGVAHDEAGRRKRSRDRSRLKAEIVESDCSREAKAAIRPGAALSQLGVHVDSLPAAGRQVARPAAAE